MPLTREQFQQLQSKGLSTQQIVAFEQGKTPVDIQAEQSRANEGFLKSTFRSITEPVATLAVRPIQLAKALGGATPEEQAVTLPFYGKIKTAETGKDVVKDIGRGAEAVALGFTGGASGVVKTGLKGLIKEGAKEGATLGLKTGATVGFGQGLEQAADEPPDQAFKTVFGSTVIGAGAGLLGGGVFGGATPIVARSVANLGKFTNIKGLEEKLSQGYKQILNPSARQLKVDSRFGNDSFSFLAKEAPDLPINVNKDGRIEADDAIELLRQKYTAEATAYKPIIRNSGKYVDIDNVIATAKRQASQEFDGSDLTKAHKQIEDEINSFLANSPQDINVTASGKRFVSLDRADDIKSYSWGRGKGWGSPEAEVWNDTNNIIGHTLKDAIEKEIPDAPIRAMNRRLGQWKNAIDILEKRNGQVSGSGGKLSKYIIRATGTAIGSNLGGETGTTGGIAGAGAGYMTANALALVMANPNVRLAVVRQILKNLQKGGRTDMIQEAQQILNEQSSKYLLPSRGGSSFVEKPNVINLPQSIRETNLGIDELRGANIAQRSNIVLPKKNTNTVINSVSMAEKVPQITKKDKKAIK